MSKYVQIARAKPYSEHKNTAKKIIVNINTLKFLDSVSLGHFLHSSQVNGDGLVMMVVVVVVVVVEVVVVVV